MTDMIFVGLILETENLPITKQNKKMGKSPVFNFNHLIFLKKKFTYILAICSDYLI